MFYFNLHQNIEIESKTQNHLNNVIGIVGSCKDNGFGTNYIYSSVKFDKYPLSDGTFLISQKKFQHQ